MYIRLIAGNLTLISRLTSVVCVKIPSIWADIINMTDIKIECSELQMTSNSIAILVWNIKKTEYQNLTPFGSPFQQTDR